jgi:serine/threonine-protein kinase HipA
MSLNGKRDNFVEEDFLDFAKTAGLKRGRDKTILAEVRDAVTRWPPFADQAGIAEKYREQIDLLHRVE